MMNKKYLIILAVTFVSSFSFAQNPNNRVSFVETFTSSTCPPCNPGNVALEALLGTPVNDGKFTSLKYQMSWPGNGDPYYTEEANSRRNMYSVSGVPHSFIDAEYDGGPGSMNQSDLDLQYAIDPGVDIQANYQVNVATQTVDVQIDIEALTNLNPGNRLLVAVFEYTTYNNVGGNGETEFEHVMKKMIPSATGTVISTLNTGDTMHYDLSYTFQGNYVLPPDAGTPVDDAVEHSVEDFTDLGVVVWVQSLSVSTVLQSAYAIMGNADIKESNESIVSAKIYPNPSINTATVAFHSTEVQDVMVNVYNTLGEVVYTTDISVIEPGRTVFTIDTEDFSNGMYNVNIVSENGSLSKRLIIQK